MNFSQLYEQFAALEDPGFWQTAYMNFYRPGLRAAGGCSTSRAWALPFSSQSSPC